MLNLDGNMVLVCSNFCLETKARVAAVSCSIKQVANFIKDHLDENDMLKSNEYTLHSLMVCGLV